MGGSVKDDHFFTLHCEKSSSTGNLCTRSLITFSACKTCTEVRTLQVPGPTTKAVYRCIIVLFHVVYSKMNENRFQIAYCGVQIQSSSVDLDCCCL